MFFAALALWELIILGILGIGVLLLLAAEQEGFATLLVAFAIGFLVWIGWEPVKEFFAQPGAALLTVKWVAIYLGIGLAFAVLKWVLYSRKKAKQYLDDERAWAEYKTKRIAELENEIALCGQWLDATPEERKLMPRSYQSNNEYEVTRSRDSAKDKLADLQKTSFLRSNNLGGGRQSYGIISVKEGDDGKAATRIDLAALGGYVSAWASYWPAYALLLVLDDFLRAVWDAVTQGLRRVFQAITRWAFKV